ncbi:UNKNOWN [Stylonychia lemnae]|uniref:Nucleolar complex protein 3 homolog n=1 Tax=Stylonychia lemnae TaxID=5949 RepID=A0A078A515_STYLE|nr:UNKNOWN [Stylonychia lemnae]|eukprot:CDW76954.1 UNKNOWN [Stylonychia lemnae]
MDANLSAADFDKKRKQKEERRRKEKENRKNKIKEHNQQKQVNPKKSVEKFNDQKKFEENKELLNQELINEMNVAQKLSFIKMTQKEIVSNADEKYRKINDLIALCGDPKDIDVVLRSIKALCEVFCDVLPAYRIREQKIDINEDNAKTNEEGKKTGGKKSQKVSKEVKVMREQEQSLLASYREYLKILEVFSKTKPEKIIRKQGIQDQQKKKRALDVYRKLRELSFISFCSLLKRHPHFNYRLNILQIIIPKISTNDEIIKKMVSSTVFELVSSDDNSLLEFKLEILKELAKVLKSLSSHNKIDPNLLDSLVTHKIIVDEQKAKVIDEATRKLTDLKQQMDKLRKKGKFTEYKEMKAELMKEMKETDALGLDLGSTSKVNNLIIKEILAIYFGILKNKSDSPLLKGVFLGLPQFTQYVNIEIVWDLISVLREYLKMELEEWENGKNSSQKRQNISNVLTGLLCSFQIIDIGAGTAFNVEEKDFLDTLYAVIQRLFEHPFNYSTTDFLAFLKCMNIVFIQRRQYSNDLVHAFVKRLALLQVHLYDTEQLAILYLMKQIITKYPTTKSSLLEMDEEGINNAFNSYEGIYKADISDPQLANASQCSIILELIHTTTLLKGSKNTVSQAAYKLAKGILLNEALQQEYLGLSALEVMKKVTKENNQLF